MQFKTRTAVLSALAVFGAAALSGSDALAQAATPQVGDMRARMGAMRQQHEAQHAQDLRTILRLRPDQEPALTAFLAADQRREGPPGAGPEGGGGPRGPMTTPQRLDLESRREAEMTARRQKHVEALRAFYAALSLDQRQVFDALQRMQHGSPLFGGQDFHGQGFGGRGPMGGPPPGPWARGDE